MRGLRPGENFSSKGPEFWSAELTAPYLPLQVRTNYPLGEEDAKTVVYRIELVDKLKQAVEAERPKFDPLLPPGMRRF